MKSEWIGIMWISEKSLNDLEYADDVHVVVCLHISQFM